MLFGLGGDTTSKRYVLTQRVQAFQPAQTVITTRQIAQFHSSCRPTTVQTRLALFGNSGNDTDRPEGTTSTVERRDSTDSFPSNLLSSLEAGELKATIQYFQNRQGEQLEQNPALPLVAWERIFAAIESRTANIDEATENLRRQQEQTTASAAAATEFPPVSEARQEMTDLYNLLAEHGYLTLFGAARTEAQPTPSEQRVVPVVGSHTISPGLLEEILSLPMKALTPQPTNTLLFAGIAFALAELMASIVFGWSFQVLTLWTLFFATLDRLFLNGAVLESALKVLSPEMQNKIVKHEAGHFLAAYLLGCPVEGCVLNAWKALQDRRFQNRAVSAGTSFFDPILSKQMNIDNKVTRSSIDRYSIIVMAGIAAEADFYGRADGGASDEMALVAFLSQLNTGRGSGLPGVIGQSGPAPPGVWNSDSIRNQARWGAVQAVMLLREYKPAYDALVAELEKGGSLGECIFAIEKAAKEHDLKPLFEPKGYIVKDNQGLDGYSYTTDKPKEHSTLEMPMTTSIDETKAPSTQLSNDVLDEEASLEQLREFREEVESKLKSIEERLNEIQ